MVLLYVWDYVDICGLLNAFTYAYVCLFVSLYQYLSLCESVSMNLFPMRSLCLCVAECVHIYETVHEVLVMKNLCD